MGSDGCCHRGVLAVQDPSTRHTFRNRGEWHGGHPPNCICTGPDGAGKKTAQSVIGHVYTWYAYECPGLQPFPGSLLNSGQVCLG